MKQYLALFVLLILLISCAPDNVSEDEITDTIQNIESNNDKIKKEENYLENRELYII